MALPQQDAAADGPRSPPHCSSPSSFPPPPSSEAPKAAASASAALYHRCKGGKGGGGGVSVYQFTQLCGAAGLFSNAAGQTRCELAFASAKADPRQRLLPPSGFRAALLRLAKERGVSRRALAEQMLRALQGEATPRGRGPRARARPAGGASQDVARADANRPQRSEEVTVERGAEAGVLAACVRRSDGGDAVHTAADGRGWAAANSSVHETERHSARCTPTMLADADTSSGGLLCTPPAGTARRGPASFSELIQQAASQRRANDSAAAAAAAAGGGHGLPAPQHSPEARDALFASPPHEPAPLASPASLDCSSDEADAGSLATQLRAGRAGLRPTTTAPQPPRALQAVPTADDDLPPPPSPLSLQAMTPVCCSGAQDNTDLCTRGGRAEPAEPSAELPPVKHAAAVPAPPPPPPPPPLSTPFHAHRPPATPAKDASAPGKPSRAAAHQEATGIPIPRAVHGPPALAAQRQLQLDPSPPAESPPPADGKAPPSGAHGDVFSRLCDASTYTGMHKYRFDRHGRGRGLAGRDSVCKGSGSVAPVYHGGQVLGLGSICNRQPADRRGVPLSASGTT